MKIDPVDDGTFGAEKSYALILDDNEAVALMVSHKGPSIVISNKAIELKSLTHIDRVTVKDRVFDTDGIFSIAEGLDKIFKVFSK